MVQCKLPGLPDRGPNSVRELGLSCRWRASAALLFRGLGSWYVPTHCTMRCASALSTALCSAFVHCVSGRHTNTWQGFGKAKNRVGMARPKKKKVEVAEVAEESICELVQSETEVTGAEQGTARENEQGLAHAHAPTTYNQKQLHDAVTAHVAAARLALDVRKVAREHAQKESLAKRLHDAKMRRLDNG